MDYSGLLDGGAQLHPVPRKGFEFLHCCWELMSLNAGKGVVDCSTVLSISLDSLLDCPPPFKVICICYQLGGLFENGLFFLLCQGC